MDFSNVIIVFTSNIIGSDPRLPLHHTQRQASVKVNGDGPGSVSTPDYSAVKARVMAAVNGHFSPEFLNCLGTSCGPVGLWPCGLVALWACGPCLFVVFARCVCGRA
jgi:hypothetical protein